MRITVCSRFLFIACIIAWLLPGSPIFAQDFFKGPEPQPGSTYVHIISDHQDSLSAQQIIEFRNPNGLPVWFARDFTKAVCLDEKCNMVNLRIYWDGAANYLKFEIPENYPLTKTDHSVFYTEDYQKLDLILSDSGSILANMEMEELIVKNTNEEKEGVDAVTAATKPALKDYLVRNAAYTCYTLWHTVYGPTRSKILSFLEQRADMNYLITVFKSGKPGYILWAIDFVENHSQYQLMFQDSIVNQLTSKNEGVSKRAFEYFRVRRLSNQGIQEKIAIRFAYLNSDLQKEVIDEFSKLEFIINVSFLTLIEHYQNGQINAGTLRKICKLIQPEERNDSSLIQKMESLSKDKNPFVRKISQNFLR